MSKEMLIRSYSKYLSQLQTKTCTALEKKNFLRYQSATKSCRAARTVVNV